MYKVDRDRDVISSLLPLFGLGATVGQQFPAAYANSYLPTALRYARGSECEFLLTIPADMPFLPADLATRLRWAFAVGVAHGGAHLTQQRDAFPQIEARAPQTLRRALDFLGQSIPGGDSGAQVLAAAQAQLADAGGAVSKNA